MRLIDADKLKRHYAWWNNEQQRDFDAIVDAQPTELRWIRSEDRVPETDGYVLCCTRTKAGQKSVVRGYHADGRWCCGMNSNVTHWMPLPEVPE